MIEITADEIAGSFVPRARPDVAMVRVGPEVVLGRIADAASFLQTCALNESGAIVWQCFDGSGTVDEIAADIADVFEADIEAVRADVAALARQVGGAGFLVGVAEEVMEIGGEPSGIPVGLPLPGFEGEYADGRAFSSETLRGRHALLVSWSPTCGFCELIGPDLARLLPSITAAQVDLVLVATGGATANRASLQRAGLTATLVLHDDHDNDAFDGLGTPVAYLVDEHGNIAEPLALGADQVVALAARIR